MTSRKRRSKDGLLFVDKPEGWTSNDVTNIVRGVFDTRKVGHAGTLDPFATGMLVMAVGRATKLIEFLQLERKEYIAGVKLGELSSTLDVDGEIVSYAKSQISDFRLQIPKMEQVEEALQGFVGKIMQRPPIHSALKVNGERAYDLARKGEITEMAEREVEVYGIDVLKFEYPHLLLDVTCGKGTYIRSLARDLGEKLGVGGYLETLRRVMSGGYGIERAMQMEKLREGGEYVWDRVIPLEEVRLDMPVMEVGEDIAEMLRVGKVLDASHPKFQISIFKSQSSKREGQKVGMVEVGRYQYVFEGELRGVVDVFEDGAVKVYKNFCS